MKIRETDKAHIPINKYIRYLSPKCSIFYSTQYIISMY